MDSRLLDILNDREDNYIMPFYFNGGDNGNISSTVESISRLGCKALCVKSDNHPNFLKKQWFDELRLILKECEKRNMKVWIFDDKGYPSGSADGAVKENPEFKKKYLLERHFDMIGPMKSATVIIKNFDINDEIIGAYLFKRVDNDESISEEFIDLSENIKESYLNFDVPEGVYRLFIYYKSNYKSDDLIDLLNPRATDMMIKNIYQPYFDELGEFFGNTLEGFLSDGVGFYPNYFFDGSDKKNRFSQTVGQAGLCLPVSDDLLRLMSKKANENIIPYLAGLWYDMGRKSAELRHNYMNTASKLFSRYFTQKIGRWCSAHNVEYISSGVAENNSNSKLGNSTGHYFRSQHGQSISGIDICDGQIVPGFSHYTNASYGNIPYTDNEFSHYSLLKLASSDSHFDTDKNRRAMCKFSREGSFAQSNRIEKWLIDFSLVRGINHFIPENLPLNESDPQYDSYRSLIDYANKSAHLLSGGVHISKALVLYNADCEWGSAQDFIYSQKICKELYDNHIDYDIISFDYLKKAEVLNHKLVLNEEKFDVLFVPFSAYIYGKNLNVLRNLETIGFDVVFVGGLPENCDHKFKSISLDECSRYYDKNCDIDLIVTGEAELMRHYHIKRGNADIYMFFNESVTKETDATVYIGRDKYLKLDLLNDSTVSGETQSGKLSVKLTPYQSAIYIFDDFEQEFSDKFKTDRKSEFYRYLNIPFDVSISEEPPYDEFEELMITDHPFNINSAEYRPDFSGKIKYSGRFYLEEKGEFLIDLKNVGENARVIINGYDVGIRVAKPFVFDISDYTVDGENRIDIIVSNTLACGLKDDSSRYNPIPSTGLQEEIVMYRKI